MKYEIYQEYLENYNELIKILFKTLTETESDEIKNKIIKFIINQEKLLKHEH